LPCNPGSKERSYETEDDRNHDPTAAAAADGIADGAANRGDEDVDEEFRDGHCHIRLLSLLLLCVCSKSNMQESCLKKRRQSDPSPSWFYSGFIENQCRAIRCERRLCPEYVDGNPALQDFRKLIPMDSTRAGFLDIDRRLGISFFRDGRHHFRQPRKLNKLHCYHTQKGLEYKISVTQPCC
jgi:hypothetical protein